MFQEPHHRYTGALLTAVPDLRGPYFAGRVSGMLPAVINPSAECLFQNQGKRKLVFSEHQIEPLKRTQSGHLLSHPNGSPGVPSTEVNRKQSRPDQT
ncbi:hypothetical protein [Bradyrhizobium ganzhouense]|uniref:ABC transporter ATP-binding protein n=1 Tax=Bradyrhizobium ganzhouense TaxID=1179767 RepID=UPI003CE6C33F